MTSVVDTVSDNSRFAQEFEDYRRACRERYQQNISVPPSVLEEETDTVDVAAERVDDAAGDITDSPTDSRIFSVSPASPSALRASSPDVNNTRLNTSVEMLKKKSVQRRNSLDKMVSAFSNVFNKKPDSPQQAREKEKAKAERKKKEQDFRMARFIAELEMEGRTDEEIQMHLFHIRDQAQFQRPRSNSVGEWFRSMHQAFKDEFSVRRDRNLVTLQVSSENPFFAAPPAGYSANELGYSYEYLASLENVPRGVKCLDHLPLVTYTEQQLCSNQTSCAICMADFEKEEKLRELPCTHHFHQECVDKWLSVGTTCPVCKGEVQPPSQ